MLVYHRNLAHSTLASVFVGGFHHVYAACHALAFKVASVPVVRAASASALVYEGAVGGYNLDVSLIA